MMHVVVFGVLSHSLSTHCDHDTSDIARSSERH
jgi:hypothetical protein